MENILVLRIVGFVIVVATGFCRPVGGFTLGEDDGKQFSPRLRYSSTVSEAAIIELFKSYALQEQYKAQLERESMIDFERNFAQHHAIIPKWEGTDPSASNSTTTNSGPEDSWSIVWYIASFSGLIAFFLIVSCSEWCCRKHVRIAAAQSAASSPNVATSAVNLETPPPAYDLFAPPSYESLSSNTRTPEKSEFDVYVVPVHAIGSVLGTHRVDATGADEPPSYSAINLSFVSDGERATNV